MLCDICESETHFRDRCPQGKGKGKTGTHLAHSSEYSGVFTEYVDFPALDYDPAEGATYFIEAYDDLEFDDSCVGRVRVRDRRRAGRPP